MSLKRFTTLKAKKGLDRSGPLRRRKAKKNPPENVWKGKRPNVALRRLSVSNALSVWARAPRVCLKCGGRFGFHDLHAHHILTRASEPALVLCASNLVPLCAVPKPFGEESCHAFAHSYPAEFAEWLESVKPGIHDYLRRLAREEWHKRSVEDAAAQIARLPHFMAHWQALEVSA